MRLAFVLLVALLASVTAEAEPQAGHEPLNAAPEHANPVMLNEYAVRLTTRGDLSTAELLLTRAALLAPHDSRIAHNLEAVRRARKPAHSSQGTTVETSNRLTGGLTQEEEACCDPALALPEKGPWPLP